MFYNGWHNPVSIGCPWRRVQHPTRSNKGHGVIQKTTYVQALEHQQELDNEPLLLREMARRTTKNNKPYLLGTLADKTGTIRAVFWEVPAHVDAWVRPGVAVLVTGKVTRYQEALQINISDLNPWLEPDMRLFLPVSYRPVEEMEADLQALMGSLSAPWRALVEQVVLDPDLYPRIVAAPAARAMHHAYLGGLLEHTLSMARLAQVIAGHYPYVNLDLLLAGVLLHDVGKALAYEVESEFAYTTDGRLVGHIVRGITLVEMAAAELGDVPAEAVQELVHLIAAHHGTLEWGSPVVPKTLEAVLLHQIDLLDSRAQGFLDHFRQDNGNEEWSSRPSAMFRTELRRPAGWEADTDERG